MAKQVGEIRIRGTVAGVTFYKMDGQYYARKKSSLQGKRVKRDPRFRRTMEWARRLARGSQLASRVYRSLPRHGQAYALFCTLKSAAIRGLKEGLSEAEVLEYLGNCLVAASASNRVGQTKMGCAGKDAGKDAPAPQPKVTGKQNAAGSGKRLRPRAVRAPRLVVGADGKLLGDLPPPWSVSARPASRQRIGKGRDAPAKKVRPLHSVCPIGRAQGL